MTHPTTLSSGMITLVVSSLGAELISLQKHNQEYLYQKQHGFWQRQSPILFPIVGALSGGSFEYDGKIYPMSQHGFARDREFEKIGEGEDFLAFRLRSDRETHEHYPFDFELILTYRIIGSNLRIEYQVKNTGKTDMFFSLGGHPAFMLRGDISEYRLHFPNDTSLERWYLQDGLMDNCDTINIQKGTLPLSEKIFSWDALVLKQLGSSVVELWRGEERILGVSRGNMPHLGIWRQLDSPFLCLEPWQGFASKRSNNIQQLSEKEGIVQLGAEEERSFWWEIIL